MLVVSDMLGVSWLWVIVPDILYMFLEAEL